MADFLLKGIGIGDELRQVIKEIDQEMINRYARASGDDNPLHTDPEFAQKTKFGGTIAQGMLSLAFISQVMTDCFQEAWIDDGEMEVAFLAPVRPGETLKAGGQVLEWDEVKGQVTCEVYCENQNGDKVVAGRAVVILS
jgi:3-hydroxybutyryl-CoA dehydratase